MANRPGERVTPDLQKQLEKVLGAAYRIERELGGAGMSRVFVATETELDRQVVIKVLPPDLAAGINTDRFRREIQLAARLQHPHIVPLHAAGARGSLLYYTMPYIGGENLRTRLTRTRELPVQEATRILREVADALSYAHSQGVVHRDIKPENILISGSHALVTDFGVSKALSSATAETSTDGPTLTSLGIALGTPAYMAPEQAAADPLVDARADIYALGVVGYELLVGSTPFAGLNQQQTLAAHITTQPAPISERRPQLPPGLAAVIMRCLEKRPSDRWQSADELHAALESFAMTSGATAPSDAVAPRRPFKWTPQRVAVAAGIVGIVVTGFIASTIAFRSGRESLVVSNTRQMTNSPGLEVHPAISPDGRMVAYVAGPWDKSRLYVRQLSGGRAIALTDSGSSADFPQWKPDGSAILYFSDGYRLVPALGGAPSAVSGLDTLVGCVWSNTGTRVACAHELSGALVIAQANGENRRTLPNTAGGDGVATIAWSPDDRLIAFSLNNNQYLAGENIGNIAPSSVWIVRTEGGDPVRISDDTHLNTSPVWTPDGSILFVSSLGGNRDIYLQRIGSDLAPRHEPVRLTTGLNAHTISLDRSGKVLAYSVFNTIANLWSTPIPTTPVESPQLRQITAGNQTIEGGYVSPDEKWLAFDSNLNGNQDIYKIPVSGGEAQQLTHNGADNFSPSWSPDGSQIAFHTLLKGNRDIYVMDASGANPTPIAATPSEELLPQWMPDGQRILYRVFPDSIFEIRRSGKGWSRPRFLVGGVGFAIPNDGTHLAIGAARGTMCDDCPPGLYLAAPDGTGSRLVATPKLRAAAAGGGNAVWSSDSRHIYLSIREKDGTSSVWQAPVNGDTEMRLLHLKDPNAQPYRVNTLDADSKNFYFPIGDRQSDIWTMGLKKK
jgi:serine/threonine protein kinase/Tol biopolymer transport system component